MGASAGGGMGGNPSSGGNVSSNTSPSQSSSGFTPMPGRMPMIPSQLPSPYQPSMGGFQGGFSPFGGGFQGGFGRPMGSPFGGGFVRGLGQGATNQYGGSQPSMSSWGYDQTGMPVEGPPMGGGMLGPQPHTQPAGGAEPLAELQVIDAFNQRNVAPSPQDMGNVQNLSNAVRNDMRFQRPSSQPVDPARFQQIRQQQMQNQFSPMANYGGFGMQQPMQGFGRMGNQGIGGAMNYMSGPRASNIGSMLSLLGMR